MALTRPTFNNINSNTLARFNDPLVVLNAANTSPNNQDIGFIFNRGSSGNVAMSWNENIDAFTLAYTSSSGQVDGNVVVTGDANLRLGNVLAGGYFYANGVAFAGGGGGTPGGANTQIQYNNNGLFSGASGVTTNGTNLTVTGGIQNTPIGNATANTGAFTTISATGTYTGTTINAATIGNVGALLTGTIQTASQPNITGLGNVTTGTWSATAVGIANGGTGATTRQNAIDALAGATTTGYYLRGNGTDVVMSAIQAADVPTLNQNTTGTAATATALTGFTNSTSASPVAADNQNQNGHAYVNANIALFSQTDGALYSQAYSTSWVHQIYGDYRTGQLAIRGKNNGTWQTWRTVLDSSNYNSYSPTLTGTGASGSWGISITGSAGSATTATNLSGGTVAATTGTFSTSATRNSRNIPTYVAAASAPASPLQGDFWYETGTDILHQYIFDGTSSQWVDVSSALVNSSTSATANTLALRDASADLYAVTFRGKATSAQYADLAENYLSDSDYAPGTVVVFGGGKEITVTNIDHDFRVAGVISTNPAYLMNSESDGLPVAFTGRVPCLVQGTVKKGDILVTSSTPGVGQVLDRTKFIPGCVIGKALDNKETEEVAIIEVVVGRF